MRFALVLLLAGCSSPTTNDPFPAETTEVTITRQGGLAPTPAEGSTCSPMDDRYSLEVATRVLSWQFCSAPANDEVFVFVPGQRTLSTGDFDHLTTALHGLTDPQPCGGDISDQIAFITPTSTTTFDRANCLGNESAVFTVLDAVAR